MNSINPITEYGRPATEKATFLIRCRAVIVCGDKMLVVNHFENAHSYELPGGRMERGEEPLTCIKREIKEELNIDIQNPVLKYIYEWKGENGEENVEFIFVVKDVFVQSDIDVKNGTHAFEIFESRWLDRNEEVDYKLYPNAVLKDFRENNFEFEKVKFVRE
ncbi:MAG: NUDIX hydrolase [Patescibacteria group bacterium]